MPLLALPPPLCQRLMPLLAVLLQSEIEVEHQYKLAEIAAKAREHALVRFACLGRVAALRSVAVPIALC